MIGSSCAGINAGVAVGILVGDGGRITVGCSVAVGAVGAVGDVAVGDIWVGSASTTGVLHPITAANKATILTASSDSDNLIR